MARILLLVIFAVLLLTLIVGTVILKHRKKNYRDDFLTGLGWWLSCFIWTIPVFVGLLMGFGRILDEKPYIDPATLPQELLHPTHPKAADRILWILEEGAVVSFREHGYLSSLGGHRAITALTVQLDGKSYVLEEPAPPADFEHRIPDGFTDSVEPRCQFIPGVPMRSAEDPEVYQLPIAADRLNKYLPAHIKIEFETYAKSGPGAFHTQQTTMEKDVLFFVVSRDQSETLNSFESQEWHATNGLTMRIWGTLFIVAGAVMLASGIAILRLV